MKGQLLLSAKSVSFIMLLLVTFSLMLLFGRLFVVNVQTQSEALCSVAALERHVASNIPLAQQAEYLTGSNMYEFSCPAETHYIAIDDIETKTSQTERQIMQRMGLDSSSETDVADYQLQKEIAKSVANCWQKTGDRDIFPQYYRLLTRDLEEDSSMWRVFTDYTKQAFGMTMYTSPKFCVVCDRYIFDESVVQSYGRGPIDVTPYLQNHSSQYAKEENIYDLVTQGNAGKEYPEFYNQLYYFNISLDTPQAVVYFRTNELKSTFADHLYQTTFFVGTMLVGGPVFGFSSKALAVVRTSAALSRFIPLGLRRGIWVVANTGSRATGAISSQITRGGWKKLAFIGTAGSIVLPDNANELQEENFDAFIKSLMHEEQFGIQIMSYSDIPLNCDLLANTYDVQKSN